MGVAKSRIYDVSHSSLFTSSRLRHFLVSCELDGYRAGGPPRSSAAEGVLNDAAWRSSQEVDVVITGLGDGRPPLLAIGEAKWNEVMGARHLERLRRIRELL